MEGGELAVGDLTTRGIAAPYAGGAVTRREDGPAAAACELACIGRTLATSRAGTCAAIGTAPSLVMNGHVLEVGSSEGRIFHVELGRRLGEKDGWVVMPKIGPGSAWE